MSYTREEILKALSIIRDICTEEEYCESCPFYRPKIDECQINDEKPSEWYIKDEKEIWRAFDE